MQQLRGGLSSLGFRGEALASLAECCVLDVTSKARGSFETHKKSLAGGNVLKQVSGGVSG